MASDAKWTSWKLRLETIKEALLALAILGGGLWALFVYAFSDSNSAKVQLERDIESGKAIGLKGQMQISSRAPEAVNGQKAPEGCLLIGLVSLQNYWPKTVDVQIDLQKPIEASPIAFDGAGHFIPKGAPITAWVSDIAGVIRPPVTVVPGRTVTIPFALMVPHNGLYLVKFSAPVADAPKDVPADKLKPATAERPDPKNYSFYTGTNRWSERAIVAACMDRQEPVAVLPPPAVNAPPVVLDPSK